MLRRVPYTRSAGRRQVDNDRQRRPEPVHNRPRLAVRCGPVTRLNGDRARAGDDRVAAQGRRAVVRRSLAFYAAAAYTFLHLPLLVLAVFSFNASRFTIWQGFSLAWYSAAFNDSRLAGAAVNSLIIAVAA